MINHHNHPHQLSYMRAISKNMLQEHSGLELYEIHAAIDQLYGHATDTDQRIDLTTLRLEVIDNGTPEHPTSHVHLRLDALAKPI